VHHKPLLQCPSCGHCSIEARSLSSPGQALGATMVDYFEYANAGIAFSASLSAPARRVWSILNCRSPAGLATSLLPMPGEPATTYDRVRDAVGAADDQVVDGADLLIGLVVDGGADDLGGAPAGGDIVHRHAAQGLRRALRKSIGCESGNRGRKGGGNE